MYTSIRDASYHVISKTLRKFRKIFSPKQIVHWTSFRKRTKVTPKEVRIHNTRTFSTALAKLFYVPRKQTKNYSPGFIDI